MACNASGTLITERSRSPMRIFSRSRYARTTSISRPSVDVDSRMVGIAARRYEINRSSITPACGGSISCKACT